MVTAAVNTFGLDLPDYPWEAMAPYLAKASEHPGGAVNLSIGTPVDRTVAGFGKTYYWVGSKRFNLPSYVDSSRSGHTAPQAYGDVCPTCYLALPLTGVCDDC